MSPHNHFNASVYATPAANSVADFLTASRPLQSSLKHWIEKLCPFNPIRLLELGSGRRPDRWRAIASLPTTRHWRVTLSDFTPAALPSPATLPHHPNFTFRLAKLNLLTDPFPRCKFHLLLASYVFDSVWFPQDVYVNQMHYPGGLIAKIHQAFTTCLHPQGSFMSIDKTSTLLVPEYEYSGPARFKTQNYDLAIPVLNQLGYRVQHLCLNDFLAAAGLSLPLDLSDHSVLIVNRTDQPSV